MVVSVTNTATGSGMDHVEWAIVAVWCALLIASTRKVEQENHTKNIQHICFNGKLTTKC